MPQNEAAPTYADLSAGAERTVVIDAGQLRKRSPSHVAAMIPDVERVEIEWQYMEPGGLVHGRILGHTGIAIAVIHVNVGWRETREDRRGNYGLPRRKG